MRIQDITDMGEDSLLNLIGQPMVIPLEPTQGAPGYAVLPAKLDCLNIKNEICLIDSGQCFRPSELPTHHGIRLLYSAPEVVFLCQPSFPSDVWSLACSIFKTRRGQPYLGRTIDGGVETKAGYVMACDDKLGAMPEPYRTVFIGIVKEEPTLQKPDCSPSDQEERVLAHLFSNIFKWNLEKRINLDAIL
jgi:serine/threonine protein kinase